MQQLSNCGRLGARQWFRNIDQITTRNGLNATTNVSARNNLWATVCGMNSSSQQLHTASQASNEPNQSPVKPYQNTKQFLRLPGAILFASVASASFASVSSAQAVQPDQREAPVSYDAPKFDKYEIPKPRGQLPESITLYQYHVCPYCCKVRAMLDYHDIPYTAVEVNPVTKSETKFSKYKKVPIIVLDGGEQINDSSAIISRLEAEVRVKGKKPNGSFSYAKSLSDTLGLPADQAAQFAARDAQWRRWVDEKFVYVMTANIYRNWREAFETFDYISERGNFSWYERELARYSGALIMWQVGKGMPAKYNIEGDLRAALYEACDQFVMSMGKSQFMGGEMPGLSDLALFGVLRAIMMTQTFRDVMSNTQIRPWYTRMTYEVGGTSEIAKAGK